MSTPIYAHGDGDGGGSLGSVTNQVINKDKIDWSMNLSNDTKDRHDLKLVGQLSLKQPGITDGSAGADVFGWQSPQTGDKYAMQAIGVTGGSVTVVEDLNAVFKPVGGKVVFARMSSEGQLKFLGTWTHPNVSPTNPGDHGEIRTYGNYGYAIWERHRSGHGDGSPGSGAPAFGLVVFDLTKLDDLNKATDLNNLDGFAQFVTTLPGLPPGALSDAHNISINQDNGYMAIYSATTVEDGDKPPSLLNRRSANTIIAKIEPGNPIPQARTTLINEGSHAGQIIQYNGSIESLKGKVLHVGADGYNNSFNFIFFGDPEDRSGVVVTQLVDENGVENFTELGRADYVALDVANDFDYVLPGEFGIKFSHDAVVSEDHEYIMVTDENNNPLVDDVAPRPSKAPVIFFKMADVVDGNPDTNLDFYCKFPVDSKGHDMRVRGNKLYKSNYSSGLRVVDISDISEAALCPSADGNIIHEIAYYDTEPRIKGFESSVVFSDKNDGLVIQAGGTNFVGAWGNYVGFEGFIIVGDILNGLVVLKEENHDDGHHD